MKYYKLLCLFAILLTLCGCQKAKVDENTTASNTVASITPTVTADVSGVPSEDISQTEEETSTSNGKSDNSTDTKSESSSEDNLPPNTDSNSAADPSTKADNASESNSTPSSDNSGGKSDTTSNSKKDEKNNNTKDDATKTGSDTVDSPVIDYNSYTEEQIIDYLCYAGDDYSHWREEYYALVFDKTGYFSCYDAQAGNPWLLLYGDTVEGTASYSVDVENQAIIVEDYERTITLHYNIISDTAMQITVEADDTVYEFVRK